MTPPKTKPVHANKADSGNSPCTCGHHITGALHGSDIHNNEETRTKDDDGSTPHSAILDSTTTPSSLLMALPDGQTETNSSSQASANTAQFAPLDASFVQIPSSFHVSADCSSNNERSQSRRPPPQQPQQQFFHGASIPTATPKEASHSISGDAMNYSSKSADFLRGLSRLHKAATFIASPPSLCVGCVQRVEQALEADTERLQTQCFAYEEAIREDKARVKGWRQAIQRAAIVVSAGMQEGEEVLSGVPSSTTENNPNTIDRSMEEAFRNEIELLEATCKQHQDELAHLLAVQKEQALIDRDLDRLQEAIAEEQNALELEARAFNNDQEQLSRALAEVQDEVERLSSSEIRLPAASLHLQVDIERGLRYPLINELRLAYRPKGDVQWQEIQAAWALAAHLLLVIATLFEFQSQHWRIVPLSRCAKLIYHPPVRNERESGFPGGQEVNGGMSRTVVFNLGHPKTNGSKALLAWNALLCQVVQHTLSKIALATENGILDAADIAPLSFAITPTNIGGISLTQLDESDDGGWSRVIHFMASDLLWLSECASSYVLQQVLLVTPLAVISATVEDDATTG